MFALPAICTDWPKLRKLALNHPKPTPGDHVYYVGDNVFVALRIDKNSYFDATGPVWLATVIRRQPPPSKDTEPGRQWGAVDWSRATRREAARLTGKVLQRVGAGFDARWMDGGVYRRARSLTEEEARSYVATRRRQLAQESDDAPEHAEPVGVDDLMSIPGIPR